jgi:hypothetical protein
MRAFTEKAVSAELAPMEAAPHRTVVTALPLAASARTAPPEAPASLALVAASAGRDTPADSTSGAAVQPVELEVPSEPPAGAAPRSAAEPLTADLRRLHVTVSKRFMEKLEAARDALSHSHPGADVETLLEEGLDLLLERAAKRRGLVKKPRARKSRPSDADRANLRYVPADVSREVFIRDEGRCQWGTADGGICGSTHRVELDHVLPVARGGRSTVANLRILCGFHNDLAAREAYGDCWMDQFTRRTKRPTSPTTQAP